MIWDLDIFFEDVYFNLMMIHNKNIKDIVCGSSNMDLLQDSPIPVTINKLTPSFKDK